MSIISKNSHYGPRTITNGLVLCLDAGNRKSYPGTGTTWTDLSGRAGIGTLTNGPTYSSANGGSLVFDGVDDFVQCSGSLTLTAATFIVWIRRNGNQSAYSGILLSRLTNVTGMSIGQNANNLLGYNWNDANIAYQWESNLTLPNLAWSMCAISVASSSATAYLCQSSGITSATNNISHATTVMDDIELFRDNQSSTRYFKGNLSQASIYNRALTAGEIAQNFNATRSRFGV